MLKWVEDLANGHVRLNLNKVAYPCDGALMWWSWKNKHDRLYSFDSLKQKIFFPLDKLLLFSRTDS